MNLDPLTFSLSQISYLVANLNKKNFKQTSQELLQLVSIYGLEAENQLLKCLLTEATKTSWDNERAGAAVNSVHASLLGWHLGSLLNHPAKSTALCRIIDQPTRHLAKVLKPSNTLLNRLSRLLKSTTAEDVAFSLLLKRSSTKPEIVSFAKQHLKKRFLDLVQCYLDAERGHQGERAGLQECSPEVLQTLLTGLANDDLQLAAVTKDLFLARLRTDFPREVVPIVLAPLLYPDDTQTPLEEMTSADDMTVAMMDTSLVEVIRDMGYAFTSSVEDCKNHMLNFGAREPTSLDVAKMISMMVRYQMGTDGPQIQTPGNFWVNHEGKKEPIPSITGETWNADIFVQTLKELASNLNWKEVILNLDHPEFIVPDRQALNLLFTILRLGLQSAGYPANIFPVEYLCRRWQNLEGQMSLISNILKHPDIFSFADHPFHPVSIDILKSPPESDNKEIATWRGLYLIELLLYLSDRGYYLQVHELFKFPLQHCPDILLLALLQISPPVTLIRQELLTTLIPIFLGNYPNSGIVLQHAWHTQNPNIKPIIMHAMADWYIRGECDQSKLSRILDVAQDLKALSMLLNVQSFPFVIDLACLASRREYLKLDKWLTDKIRDHGETFVSAMVKFLQRRCPPVIGKVPEEPLPKAAQLPPETIGTMLACLQLCVPNVQQELQEAIYNVIASCQTLMLSKPRQAMAGIARPHTRVLETPFNPAGMAGQLFTPHVDPIATLTPGVANITLGAPANTAFAIPGTLGPLVTAPGSPSRLMGAGPNSPFAMMPIPHNPQVPNMGALARMAPVPAMDKPRIPDPIHFPEMILNVSKEIEDEANGYFQRIYNHPPHPTLSIDEVLDMLKKFQDSPNKREREVFSCMLRNLFEEYKFFPQYPDKELHITAQLFGGIIEKGLVPSYVSLGLALRFVLDALRKPEGSKMYYFGIAALDRFKSRLKDYHKYCEHVRAIPHFNEFPPHLIEYVEYGLQSQEPPTKPNGPVLPASLAAILNQNAVVTVSAPYRAVVCAPNAISVMSKVTNCGAGGIGTRPSIANATNIDTLLTATDREEKLSAPPEAIQDKTAFIFNNLSQLNLQTKCEELKDIITDEYYPWLSQYLVMKRASIELNFHALYSNFLDVLKVRDVNNMVTKETYRNIRVLLRSDKGIANFSDRSLLKNLGHWLGMLTLARNQPILYVDLDLKALLLEAYHKGQQELLYVVPFVAKVLESCAKSVVFKPPNPWTMALMNVLAELHQEPDLKLNLKFEIEVLCKNLSLDIAELKPSLYLKDPEKLRTIEFQLSQPKPAKEASAGTPMLVNPMGPPPQIQMIPPSMINEEMSSVAPGALVAADPMMGVLGIPEPRYNYLDVNVTSASAFGQKIILNPHIILFQNYPQLKQFVKPTIERSIQEWIHPVVDRSIKYALTTCEMIIRKDFAFDPDEVRMRTCAHHMMRNLTAGMAMITCREQIISTISTNLKAAFITALMPPTQQQKDIVESAAAVLATENMELACAFIQKTAVEKALPELDKRLLNDYEMRKIARQEGRRYYDQMVLTYQSERIPERVRLRVGGPTDMQISVYEEFACNIPGFMPVRDAGMFMPKPSAPEQMQQLTYSQVMNPTQVLLYRSPINNLNVDPRTYLLWVQQSNEAAEGHPEPALTREENRPGYWWSNIVEQNFNTIPFNYEMIPPALVYGTDEMGALINAAEMFLSNALTLPTFAVQATNMHTLLECLVMARRNRDIVSGCALLQRAVEGLLDGHIVSPTASSEHVELMTRYRDIHLRVLKLLEDARVYGHVWTTKQITCCLAECRDELKYNIEAIDCLIRNHLINMPQYDLSLAHLMDNGNNYVAVAFAMQLVQLYLVDDRNNMHASEADFYHTTETLIRIMSHARTPPPEGLASLIEAIRINQDPSTYLGERSPLGPTAHIHQGIMQVRAREYDDPQGLQEKTENLLREWRNILMSPLTEIEIAQNFNVYVHRMNMNGILKSDDMITRFFRIATQMCVESVYQMLNEDRTNNLQPNLIKRDRYYNVCDTFIKLVSLLIKNTADSGNPTPKLNLLNKILGIIAGCLLQDHEDQGTNFQQLPYHRLLLILFLDMNMAEPVLESMNYQVLTAFCHVLRIVRPSVAPGFCYAWLELVSHRAFINRVLAVTPQQKGWGMYSTLLIDLFKFLDPYLRNTELAPPVMMLYKGMLKVLLVLLHDFPEFLCDYHYGFCDEIPPNCIQMRNLILSAFPRNMRLPDPFTPNLKVDLLAEIAVPPRAVINYATLIPNSQFKKDLDAYLKARAPVTFLSELRSNMQVLNEPGRRYNHQLMNAVVLYVGTQSIQYIRSKGQVPNMTTIAHSAHMDIFQNFTVDFDFEGRYLFLNALANQLRYPNSHTHFFSCVLLYLFVEANSEAVQEQITRMLLERLIVNRPHPWGLLVTFIELIKNPTYKFWSHEFVHCAPEIEKLFASVARSCIADKVLHPSLAYQKDTAPTSSSPNGARPSSSYVLESPPPSLKPLDTPVRPQFNRCICPPPRSETNQNQLSQPPRPRAPFSGTSSLRSNAHCDTSSEAPALADHQTNANHPIGPHTNPLDSLPFYNVPHHIDVVVSPLGIPFLVYRQLEPQNCERKPSSNDYPNQIGHPDQAGTSSYQGDMNQSNVNQLNHPDLNFSNLNEYPALSNGVRPSKFPKRSTGSAIEHSVANGLPTIATNAYTNIITPLSTNTHPTYSQIASLKEATSPRSPVVVTVNHHPTSIGTESSATPNFLSPMYSSANASPSIKTYASVCKSPRTIVVSYSTPVGDTASRSVDNVNGLAPSTSAISAPNRTFLSPRNRTGSDNENAYPISGRPISTGRSPITIVTSFTNTTDSATLTGGSSSFRRSPGSGPVHSSYFPTASTVATETSAPSDARYAVDTSPRTIMVTYNVTSANSVIATPTSNYSFAGSVSPSNAVCRSVTYLNASTISKSCSPGGTSNYNHSNQTDIQTSNTTHADASGAPVQTYTDAGTPAPTDTNSFPRRTFDSRRRFHTQARSYKSNYSSTKTYINTNNHSKTFNQPNDSDPTNDANSRYSNGYSNARGHRGTRGRGTRGHPSQSGYGSGKGTRGSFAPGGYSNRGDYYNPKNY